MILTQWMLRGMAMDKHLVFSESVIEYYVRLWCRVMASVIYTPNLMSIHRLRVLSFGI
jgi:hypothetical protein